MLALLLLAAGTAWNVASATPGFDPAIYADGATWGTRAVTELPAPNGHNAQSFDKLFVFTNSDNPDQLPVGEAAPGNPAYNGGRWFTHTVTWNMTGVPVLRSYDEIMQYAAGGSLTVEAGSPPGGPPPYFECPLLPTH
jgi:hypothetical protein